MPGTALSLIILSTFMHAGWNLMVRRTRSELVFVHRMLIAGSILGLVPAVASAIVFEPLPIKTFQFLLASGICCGLYFVGLAKGYSVSDFTIIYPLARALPVLLLGITDIVLHRAPTPLGWTGLGLVVAGCILAPLTSLRNVQRAHYVNRTMLWILLAAMGTIGYSLIDKSGAQFIQEHVAPGWWTSLHYAYYFFLVATAIYTVLLRIGNTSKSDSGKVGWFLPAVASVLNVGSYALIVWVFQMTHQVSYVVASRQFSIVIGVLVGFALFHEPGRFVRTLSALLLTAGLIVISARG